MKKPWLVSLVLHHSKNIVTTLFDIYFNSRRIQKWLWFNFCVPVSLIEKSLKEKSINVSRKDFENAWKFQGNIYRKRSHWRWRVGVFKKKKKQWCLIFLIYFLLCLLRYWLLFKAMIIGFYFVSDKYYKESRNKRINSNT